MDFGRTAYSSPKRIPQNVIEPTRVVSNQENGYAAQAGLSQEHGFFAQTDRVFEPALVPSIF